MYYIIFRINIYKGALLITISIKSKYNKFLTSWGIINFYGPLTSRKSTFKEINNYNNKQKHPIKISDIIMIRGFN